MSLLSSCYLAMLSIIMTDIQKEREIILRIQPHCDGSDLFPKIYHKLHIKLLVNWLLISPQSWLCLALYKFYDVYSRAAPPRQARLGSSLPAGMEKAKPGIHFLLQGFVFTQKHNKDVNIWVEEEHWMKTNIVGNLLKFVPL